MIKVIKVITIKNVMNLVEFAINYILHQLIAILLKVDKTCYSRFQNVCLQI